MTVAGSGGVCVSNSARSAVDVMIGMDESDSSLCSPNVQQSSVCCLNISRRCSFSAAAISLVVSSFGVCFDFFAFLGGFLRGFRFLLFVFDEVDSSSITMIGMDAVETGCKAEG